MTLYAASNPYPVILNQSGTGLNGGKVYIGLPNQDPETFPAAVFWDAAGTVPASQPLTTVGGYIWNAGTPAEAFCPSSYSIRVRDRFGAEIFYSAHIGGPLQDYIALLATNGGAAMIGTAAGITVEAYLQDLRAKSLYTVELATNITTTTIPASVNSFQTAGYYTRGDDGAGLWVRQASNPAHSAKRQSADGAWWTLASKTVYPEQLGAKGDGATDDTTAITQAISFADVVLFGAKTYNHSGLVVNRQCYMRGVSRNKTVLKCTIATGIAISLAQSPFNLSDMTVDRSVAATAGYGVATLQDGFGTIERLIIQNHWIGLQLNSTADSIARDVTSQTNYSHGVELKTSSTMPACQWKMYGFISQKNDGAGYSFYAVTHSSGAFQTGPVGVNIGSYANSGGGMIFSGDNGTAWNDVNFIHPYSSFDANVGIGWYKPGANNQLLDVFVEGAGTQATGRTQTTAATNAGSGILFDLGGTDESYILVSGKSQYNSNQGLSVTAASSLRFLQLNGFFARDNGAALSQRNGIEIQSTIVRTQFSNVVSRNIKTANQQYGLATNATTAAKIWIWGADMGGNATGASNVSSGSFGAFNVAT